MVSNMQVLQRGQSISKRDWKLIRVAIVDMQSFTYIGRLFFGNQETGEVAWDCDCRPSDGMWLAQQVLGSNLCCSSLLCKLFCMNEGYPQTGWHNYRFRLHPNALTIITHMLHASCAIAQRANLICTYSSNSGSDLSHSDA